MELNEIRNILLSNKVIVKNGSIFQKHRNWNNNLSQLSTNDLNIWNSTLSEFECVDELFFFICHPDINPSDFVCLNCGKVLKYSQWKPKYLEKTFYCSNSCKLKYSKEKRNQTNLLRYGFENAGNHNKSDEQLEYELNPKKCIICNSDIPYSLRNSNVCSTRCSGVVKKNKQIRIEYQYSLNPKMCEYCGKPIEYRKRNSKTCSDKCAHEINQIKSKITMVERYGVEYAFQNKELLDKARKTCMNRYGVENASSSELVRDKVKKTCMDKYGVSNPLKDKSVRNRIKKTCLEKYGVDCTCLITHDENVKKGIQTKLERYGTLVINSHRFNYDGMNFDSRDELYFYIYNKEILHKDIQRGDIFNYEFDNKIHRYFCDFKVDEQNIEIKGGHYINENGLFFPYVNQTEVDSNEVQKQWNAKYDCMIKNNVKIISTDSDEMKEIIKVVDNTFTSDYVKLFMVNQPFPYPNLNLQNKTDIGLIRHFHKSIYDAKREGHISPSEAWYNKSLVKKSALNRLQYIGTCSSSDVLQGFNIAKIAPKVSVFRPTVAEEILKKYCTTNNIFDPFSGFSGRMIGAMRLDKKYEGQDINKIHVQESNQIIEYRKYENCSVVVQDILTDSDRIFQSSTTLFTCPPYNLKEQWNENDSDKSCDEWIDICIQKYKCKEYIFVVDKTEKYRDFIVDKIINKSHFGTNTEFVVKLL